MDTDEVASELDTFASWPRAFTVQELLDFADSEIDGEMLERALESDHRFVPLGRGGFDGDYFIAESALFRWFSSLNLRLAQARQSRLSERQLVMAMNSLRAAGRWDAPPSEVAEFGERVGFCERSRAFGGYVFPIARLLSSVPALCLRIAADLLETSLDLREARPLSEADLRSLVEQILSPFDERVAYVVQAREGLLDTRRLTLEETAAALSMSFGTQRLTRERIRQLEAQFWKKIAGLMSGQPHSAPMTRQSFLRPLLGALLRHVMGKRGSLIVRTDSLEGALERFVAKCTGIPSTELPGGALAMLGAGPDDLAILNSLSWSPGEIDQDSVARRLCLEAGLELVDGDVGVVAKTISRYLADDLHGLQRVVKLQSVTKAQKVYLALREIGKPAHYSEVAEVYSSLFSDDPSSERNIHAILCREEHGVVWIGVRGTYALEEWGYDRPSKALFEAVADIVENQYDATGTPVPFAVISAEIGKLRRVVKFSSLTFATHCNPRLRRVSSDSFVPRTPDEQAEEEIPEDELDKILQEFEEDALDDSRASPTSAERVAGVGAVPQRRGRFARLAAIARRALPGKRDEGGDDSVAGPSTERRQDGRKGRIKESPPPPGSQELELMGEPRETRVMATTDVVLQQQAGIKETAPRSDAAPPEHQAAGARRKHIIHPPGERRAQTKALLALLHSKGLEVIDERPRGGYLWVIGGKELYSFLSPRGFIWGPRGAPATGNRAGWYLP
jgi:hypothetical protein